MKSKARLTNPRVYRHDRIRKKLSGSTERPRLSIYRSTNHFEAQIVDDSIQKTIVGVSTKSAEFKSKIKTTGNKVAAAALGKWLAEQAKAKGITQVVFDRGGYLYHGRIKEFADAARSGGLAF